MRSFTGMPNTTGTEPHVEAIPDTLPGQHDGTPLLARWVNELFGFLQASMNGAGLMPSGTAEAAGASAGDIESSQVLQAIQAMFRPAGEYVMIAHTHVPVGARLLECNGQVVLCATYPRLVANTYCGNTKNASAPAFYKASDSGGVTHSTSGAYFKLPDLRGYFLRGYDPTEECDPLGNSKEFGEQCMYTLIQHTHTSLYTALDEGGNEIPIDYTHKEGTGANISALSIGGSAKAYTGYVTGTAPLVQDADNAPFNSPALICITF